MCPAERSLECWLGSQLSSEEGREGQLAAGSSIRLDLYCVAASSDLLGQRAQRLRVLTYGR